MKYIPCRMPRLSNFMRANVIEMLKSEKSQRQVAKSLGISRCAVQNIHKKYVESGTTDDLPKCGRPPKNSQKLSSEL